MGGLGEVREMRNRKVNPRNKMRLFSVFPWLSIREKYEKYGATEGLRSRAGS